MSATTTSLRFYSLDYKDSRTYVLAALFLLGNIVLPQLCHLVPGGGLRWLPIYFFTLAGAYKYGWRPGVLTAIASPLANSLLFGMPAAGMLPVIMLKSVALAGVAGYAGRRFGRVSLPILLGVVLLYQLLGGAGEFFLNLVDGQSAHAALAACLQDFRIGLPGLAAQVFLGYSVIKKL